MDKEQAFARFRQAFGYLKDSGILHKQADLCEPLGISRSHLSEFFNGKDKYFTEGNLRRFATAFSDYINEGWLLTGEGKMEVPDKNMRPHFPAKVEAGLLGGELPQLAETEVEMEPLIKRLPPYDFLIDVSGSSMEPSYYDGDMVACRRIFDRSELKPGGVYVFATRDGAVLKRFVSATKSSIRVASDNLDYKPYNIDTDLLLNIFEVVGSISNRPRARFEISPAMQKSLRLYIAKIIGQKEISPQKIDEIIEAVTNSVR